VNETIDRTPLGVARSAGAFQFTSNGLPGAGARKILSYKTGQWYGAMLSLNGPGACDVSNVTATVNEGVWIEGMIYPPLGSPKVKVLGCS